MMRDTCLQVILLAATGEEVGFITSGLYTPSLKKTIALASVSVRLSFSFHFIFIQFRLTFRLIFASID